MTVSATQNLYRPPITLTGDLSIMTGTKAWMNGTLPILIEAGPPLMTALLGKPYVGSEDEKYRFFGVNPWTGSFHQLELSWDRIEVTSGMGGSLTSKDTRLLWGRPRKLVNARTEKMITFDITYEGGPVGRVNIDGVGPLLLLSGSSIMDILLQSTFLVFASHLRRPNELAAGLVT